MAAASALALVIYLGLRAVAAPRPTPNGGPAFIDSLDVIKTTITVAGFIGAVLVAVYAHRKQRLLEGDAQRADAEQLARRYTTAADQLGHEKAAVRLAGVYAMARLADDWGEQRQVCIAVLCAYLRMPYELDRLSERYREGEQEVRLTIIRIIRDHLLDPSASTTWCGRDLDFTNTTFDGGDFSGAKFTGGKVSFDYARFISGTISFEEAEFAGGTVSFEKAEFSGGKVSLRLVKFSAAIASFREANFSGGNVSFGSAEFNGGKVTFEEAKVNGGSVSFRSAEFGGGVVSFKLTEFSGGNVFFESAKFSGSEVFFDYATFSGGKISFPLAKFTGGKVSFDGATFGGSKVCFYLAKSSGSKVSFIQDPDLLNDTDLVNASVTWGPFEALAPNSPAEPKNGGSG